MSAPFSTAKEPLAGGAPPVEVNVGKTFLAATQKLALTDRARVFDFLAKFMNNPAHPGISLERVQNTGDAEMWSARITQNLRAILHRSGNRAILLYAGPHDDAYHWAQRRRLEHHPITGTLQIVETTETMEELLTDSAPPPGGQGLFDHLEDDYLLSLGVPRDWLPTLRRIHHEDQVLIASEQLPEEVGERLLALASGEFVTPPLPIAPDRPLAENPDNLRRFWVVQDAEELLDVLSRPLSDWVKFLHPSQQRLVTGTFRGAVKVTGAAGTGKTVVALHRAKHLAALGHQVFLTSYVSTLCRNLRRNLQILCPDEALARITVRTIHHQALSLAQQVLPALRPLESKEFNDLLTRLRPPEWAASDLTPEFLTAEWMGVVEPRGITSWEEYRDSPRTGRQRRLAVAERQGCWRVFEALRDEMERLTAYPWPQICDLARIALESGQVQSHFEAVIVDEVQDLDPAGLRLVAELARNATHNLLLVGDAGQRIYPGGFSLRKLGIDVRGRSHVLRINYRTTEQIRRFADKLLPETMDDLDSALYHRRSQCLLHGPTPQMVGFDHPDAEDQFVADRIGQLLKEGLTVNDVAVFARTGKRLESLRASLESRGIASQLLSRDDDADQADAVSTGTMHRAKGLEFKVVFAIDCTEGVLPHDRALAQADLQDDHREALDRERHLLYVTLTRARDETLVSWTGEPSPFLKDLADTE